MELFLLIFFYACFIIGSPSFIVVVYMMLLRRYINRYFIYGALTTLIFVLICYYVYFIYNDGLHHLINKVACKSAELEPEASLGIMECFTYLDAILDFFAFPLIMVLLATSLAWIFMFIVLMRNNVCTSIKTIRKSFKRKSFMYGILFYVIELLLVGSAYIYAKMTYNGNYIVVVCISILIAFLSALLLKLKIIKDDNAK